MSKGSYTVGEGSNNSTPKDTSFRSFICILLIFLAICLIILLASINWSGRKSHPEDADKEPIKKEDRAETFANTGTKSNKTSDKLVVSPEFTTRDKVRTRKVSAPTTPLSTKFENTTTTQRVNSTFTTSSRDSNRKFPKVVTDATSTTIAANDRQTVSEATISNSTVTVVPTRPTKKGTKKFTESKIAEATTNEFVETTRKSTIHRNPTTSKKVYETTTEIENTSLGNTVRNTSSKWKTNQELVGDSSDQTTETESTIKVVATTLGLLPYSSISSTTTTTNPSTKVYTTTEIENTNLGNTIRSTSSEWKTLQGLVGDSSDQTTSSAIFVASTKNTGNFSGTKVDSESTDTESTIKVVATTEPSKLRTTLGLLPHSSISSTRTTTNPTTSKTSQGVVGDVSDQTTSASYSVSSTKNSNFSRTETETTSTETDLTIKAEESSSTEPSKLRIKLRLLPYYSSKYSTTSTTNPTTSFHDDVSDQASNSTSSVSSTKNSNFNKTDSTSTTLATVNPKIMNSTKKIPETTTYKAQITSTELTTKVKVTSNDEATETTLSLEKRKVKKHPDLTEADYGDHQTVDETTVEKLSTVVNTEPPKTTVSIKYKSSEPVCTSSVCNVAASHILSLMNHSVTPCEDFYEFACGGVYRSWKESAESIKDTLSTQLNGIYNSSPKYLRNFKEFYHSCLDYDNTFKYRERIRGVEDLLKTVGGFQFGNQSYDLDLTDLVAKLILRESMPLFDIGLDVDKQSSNLILQLTLPQQSFIRTGLGSWSALSSSQKDRCLKKQQSQLAGLDVNLTKLYESYVECQKDYAGYLDSVQRVILELESLNKLNPQEQNAEIKQIRFNIEFEVLMQLDSLPSSAEILRNYVNKKYDVRKISDLQMQFPIVDWKRLFRTLTRHEVRDDSTVQVYFGEYFKTIFESLGRIDKRKLYNAFMAIYANDLFVNTVIPRDKSNRERFCVDLSKKLLPDVWAYLAAESSEDRVDQNRKTTELFEVLKKRFCRSILEAEWIDDKSKPSIISKCNKLTLALFSPPDQGTLIKNYQNLTITDNYQTNIIELLEHFKQTIYSTEGSKISPEAIFSYFLDPLGSKALTFYSSEIIAVPLGLTRKAPVGLPEYLTMARLGFALARQIARHFDPTGMDYKIVLSPSSKATYSELISTMKTMMQYSSPRMFDRRNITFHLDGTLSTNERIVDNAAFRLVLDSYRDDGELLPWISMTYSREKIFIIGVAQEFCEKKTILDFMLQVFERRHIPAVLRVENIMANSQQFSDKFSCPDGSGMNQLAQREQFPHLIPVDDYDEDYVHGTK